MCGRLAVICMGGCGSDLCGLRHGCGVGGLQVLAKGTGTAMVACHAMAMGTGRGRRTAGLRFCSSRMGLR